MRYHVLLLAAVVVAAAVLAATSWWLWTLKKKKQQRRLEPTIPDPVKIVVRKRKKVRAVEARDATAEIVAGMESLVTTFERSRDWTVPLRLAGVYERGAYPVFTSDQETARTLYMAVATMASDPAVAAHARTKVVIALDPDDEAGRRLPPEPATRMFKAMKRVSEMERAYAVERVEDPVAFFALEPTIIYEDAQNVHDHGVVASLRKMATKTAAGLGEEGKTTGAVRQEVIDAIVETMPDLDEATRADAIAFVADHVDDAVVASVGTSAAAALRDTWTKIGAIDDPERRANAAETLARQMADGYERGNPVCATGRVARILGALDGVVATEHAIRPTWAVREELAGMAAKCSNEGLGGEAFEKMAMKTYVQDLGMLEEVVRPIVDEYKTYIEE